MSSLRPYISLDGGYFPFETQNTFSSPVRNTGQIIVILFLYFLLLTSFVYDIGDITKFYIFNSVKKTAMLLQLPLQDLNKGAPADLTFVLSLFLNCCLLCVILMFLILLRHTYIFCAHHLHHCATLYTDPFRSCYRSPKPCICAYIAHIQGQ